MRSSILIWFLLSTPQIPITATQFPEQILERAALDIRRNEPSWQFGHPVCNIPLLMAGQEDFSCGLFQIVNGARTVIVASVTVHQIINPETVSRWLTNFQTRTTAGWVVVPYDLGVSAYLSTLQNPPTVEITFGKGRFVVTVNGTSKMDVDRVARSLLKQMVD